MSKKPTTLTKALYEVLPSFNVILKRKLKFAEKHKLALIVKDIMTKKESYDKCIEDFLLEHCELDEQGKPKIIPIPTDPRIADYVFKTPTGKTDFARYQMSLLEEPCEILPYGISEATLEEAFKSDDKELQVKLDAELGEIFPYILDFLL